MISLPGRSLRGRILLSASAAVVLLVLLTGWVVQRHVVRTATQLAQNEVKSSFQAYESLWSSRLRELASASLILSAMSDVRAAFSTRDAATIRDTAGELWGRISDSAAIFLVTDPTGRVIASLGGTPGTRLPSDLPVVRQAAEQFPEQASGFLSQDRQSFQVVVTPVYVQSGSGTALLNVLVAGYRLDAAILTELKDATGGSEFLFVAEDRVLAATVPASEGDAWVAALHSVEPGGTVQVGENEFAPLVQPLLDVEGKQVAQLWICRSFQEVRERIAGLQRDILLILLAALLVGLALTQLLARRIISPIEKLDEAAGEIVKQNYDVRLQPASDDELGRLAKTFNEMSESIQRARDNLVRQERIATIGRMATSIIHDLRNPLAAIYGGAEMLVDSELPPASVKRLAMNIYRASRSMQTMLTDLRNVSRGKTEGLETCRLREVVSAGFEPLRELAGSQAVQVEVEVNGDLECSIERGRVERVFTNLIANSLDAMPDGGTIRIAARKEGESVVVEVSDTGPGIAEDVRERLFQPFTGTNKRNGMGLGLALSRQTMLDHGGDLWEESETGSGARFLVRFG